MLKLCSIFIFGCIAGMFGLTIVCALSALYNWVPVSFNLLHEGYIELILFPVMAVGGLISAIKIFRLKVREF